MPLPENYTTFCARFKNEPQFQTVQFLRSWLIDRQDADKSGHDYTDFDEMTSLLDNPQKCDGVSRIAAMTGEAFAHIVASPHSEIIREDVLMPLYKVKEVDSYCINWLSRRSGRTVREKLASTTSMMAVRRRESLDTGENRLLKAFASRLADCIRIKQQFMPEYATEAENDFVRKADLLLRREDFQEVRRWENLPPNNTLLSDKNYSKIWRGWQELQKLEDVLKADCKHSASRLRTYFTWRLLQEARKFFVFPQIPVKWNYEDFRISVDGNKVYGYDAGTREELRFTWDDSDDNLNVTCGEQEFRLTFLPGRVEVESRDGEERHAYDLAPETIDSAIAQLAELLWRDDGSIPATFTNKGKLPEDGGPADSAIVDILAVRPRCMIDDAPARMLPFRLMRQSISEKYDMSAAFSDAVHCEKDAWEPFTLNRVLADKNVADKEERAAALLKLLSERLDVKRLTLLFPDLYDDFQLSPVRRAANLYYAHTRSIPKSIAAVFDRESRGRTSPEEAYVVVDTINGKLSMTLVVGNDTDENGNPLPRVVWERHPQEDVLLSEPRNFWELSYGASPSTDADENLTLNVGDAWRAVKFDSTDTDVRKYVEEFLAKRQKYVSGKKVRLILLSPKLQCAGGWAFERIAVDGCLNGARYCERLSEKLPADAKFALWKDHLPELAIKQLHDRFELVKDFSARPIVNQDVTIEIKKYFTLPQGKDEYHFQLVKSEGGEAMLYEAFIKHHAFPLAHDTKCKLRMTYRYGSEHPYMLYFEPLDPEQAGFTCAKVEWNRLKEYRFEDLPVPKFPEPPSWEALSEHPLIDKRNGKVTHTNLFKMAERQLKGSNRWDKTLDLSYCEQRITGIGNYEKLVIKDEINQRFIVLQKSNFQPVSKQNVLHFGDNIKKIIDCLLLEETCYADNLDWIPSRNYAFWTDEQGDNIAFFQGRFLYQEEYEEEPFEVYFSKKKSDKGYYADNIRCVNWPVFRYEGKVQTIVEANNRISKILFPLHTIFAGGRSLDSLEFPEELRNVILNVVPDLISLFSTTRDKFLKSTLVKILSLVTCSVCPGFYLIAYGLLEQEQEVHFIPSELGILIGNGTTNEQKEILTRICALKDKTKAVCFISRALWKNPGLIFNMPWETLLAYLETSVTALEKDKLVEQSGELDKKIRYTDPALEILEYCFAVFRLRERSDCERKRRLSLNNLLIERLRREVERRVDEVRGKPSHEARYISRINFDEKTIEAAKSKNMPVFLYAMLVYITGDRGENEIKITEIAEDSD